MYCITNSANQKLIESTLSEVEGALPAEVLTPLVSAFFDFAQNAYHFCDKCLQIENCCLFIRMTLERKMSETFYRIWPSKSTSLPQPKISLYVRLFFYTSKSFVCRWASSRIANGPKHQSICPPSGLAVATPKKEAKPHGLAPQTYKPTNPA